MNKAAQELGRMGGKARAKSLSKKRRREIAMMGVKARAAVRQKKMLAT